jgi:hypothetical protein
MLRPLTLVLLVVALVIRHSPAARAQSPLEIRGEYYCDGIDVDGHAYHGRVSIAKRDAVYYVVWRFGSTLAAVGIGIMRDDVLAVSYYGPSPGVAVYRIDGTSLKGRWTDAGTPGHVFVETWTRVHGRDRDEASFLVSSPHQHEHRLAFGDFRNGVT